MSRGKKISRNDKESLIELMREELRRNYYINVDLKIKEGYVSGAGDSYAAALCIEGKTKGRFRAIDPYEGQEYDIKKPLIVVSISGRTKSNINLARKFKSKTEIIVITANENSELAKIADYLILLPIQPKRLPGISTFLASLSALYSIAGEKIDEESDVPIILPKNPFFIGKGENYGVAYYAYLKLAEIYGEYSYFERLEQFFHAPVFISRGSNIVIFGSNDPREELEINFAKVYKSRCKGAFCNTKWFLESLIKRMEIEKWEKIYFLEDKEILEFSSLNIY
ncbi:MAG: SIS domain-containing protein [Sulfolobaceae archaeon]